ncbi:MAG TPA: S41 family peptidase [Steroidobacteraceae bacterium]|nr:S41 family peptidase [Steroidobacteraceae bacterium]
MGQARSAVLEKYADLEWDVTERGLELNSAFADAQSRIQQARDVGDVRVAFEKLAGRFGERHVQFVWPKSQHGARATLCGSLGYDTRMQAPPLASLLSGYVPLRVQGADVFPTGTLMSNGTKVGILKIPLFSAQGFPNLCEQALEALQIPRDSLCSQDCEDRITSWTANRMTENLASVLEALRQNDVHVLLIDIAENGGGTEWVEAAARMVTTKPVKSQRISGIHGEHWVRRFAHMEDQVRDAIAAASPADRDRLRDLLSEVSRRKHLTAEPCNPEPLLRGEPLSCSWLVDGFFDSGLIQSAESNECRKEAWCREVFTPVQFPYSEGLWNAPVVVLVDESTGSAAEQFAATLQDNHAALIVGSPTAGAGCGHTDGGTPTRLKNSGVILELPDCVRMRADGSNLANGVQPDVLVGLRGKDGPRRRAKILQDALANIVQRAIALAGRPTDPSR